VGRVGRGQILVLAGIALAAAGGCWRLRQSKSGRLNRPGSQVATRPTHTWVGGVGEWPEHDQKERELDVWGGGRALLSELDAAHTGAEEREGCCGTWERAPREGCEP
jgi:hypothetical protein